VDNNAKELLKQGDKLFKREGLLSLWQEIALNFYPERADFTVTRNMGDTFADHLLTSYPLLARRDLGNSFSSMLRRDDWFHIKTKNETDNEGKAWMEWATGVQKKAMYDRVARFERATKEGDHDFAAFGQCVITTELNRDRSALLYRSWHLRDVAWCENVEGEIDTVHQKWKPTARQLVQMFPGRCHPKIVDRAQKDPYAEIDCRRVVIASSLYDTEYAGAPKNRGRFPFVSLYLDVVNQHVMEEMPLMFNPYVIPRWQTVSGSQYAFSPATVAALPDARLIQAMMLTLLDAGEKASNPPMLAVGDAIRSDIDLRAGGITWVDSEYDERLGEVLRPLSIDSKGFPLGFELMSGIREMIGEAFFLNKLTLPMQAGDMTATEVSQRVQEYIRQALPLFEPMEKNYNAALCENTFNILMAAGVFGGDIPDSLRGKVVDFKFESPLHMAVELEKGTKLGNAVQLTMATMQLDPGASSNLDAGTALRDALEGIGVPQRWIRDEQQAAQIADAMAQQQAKQAQIQQAQAAGDAGQALGGAAQSMGVNQ
jgi:hypothetical protein